MISVLSCRSLLLVAAAIPHGLAATVAEAAASDFDAALTGAMEVPGPGDADGQGSAEVKIDPTALQVCYEIEVGGIDAATMAHIHRGVAGVAGPVVVKFEPPASGESKGCVAVTRALADEIVASPSGFYVNVHNAAYPGGAIRGQLTD